MGLTGLQAGYMNRSESNSSIRIDLRPKIWQSTSIVACFGLVTAVACVMLVVAIYDMGEEGEKGDGGMDEEEEEGKNDDDDMEEE